MKSLCVSAIVLLALFWSEVSASPVSRSKNHRPGRLFRIEHLKNLLGRLTHEGAVRGQQRQQDMTHANQPWHAIAGSHNNEAAGKIKTASLPDTDLLSGLGSDADSVDGVEKRQGMWDYDYGLGGGRFGKRGGDYGIGGGRWGRDVDHVDISN